MLRSPFILLILATLSSGAQEPAPEPPHAQIIRAWDRESFARGKQVYDSVCITCHGTPDQEGTLPTSRAFWKEPFKNGSDPFNIYKTLTHGLGQMPAWTFLSPRERYDATHYIREAFIKPHNPQAYFEITEKYLVALPRGSTNFSVSATTPNLPPYLRMDFGPALFWTIEAAKGNIAYKGIAIRLDDGPGGISKGRAWILYDHDTLRAAAAWTGTNFIDWRGIAFDGSHGTHASIVGEKIFVNPAGPGWADPRTGTLADPRLRGRDGKPYGPLPREWARYKGAYFAGNQVVLSYSIGAAQVLELPALEHGLVTRTLNISPSSNDLLMRVAPVGIDVSLAHSSGSSLITSNRFTFLRVPASLIPVRLKVVFGKANQLFEPAADLTPLTRGGPARWNPPIATRGKLGASDGPFAVDELVPPDDRSDPWQTWMRFGAFDFFRDPSRGAICTWNGDVWLVSGIDSTLQQLTWKRIASGLFQPLGLKIVNDIIHVTCRDQLARLYDLNADEEIDFVENFNNDHQVTEHFHEFAMGLQTDAAGNFYYAKSARHALPAVVPHHGTLLKVSADGAHTEIIASGFRAANGVCINDDGTFFITDQEGHWTPKNRINWVHPGRFYGNLFGYTDRTSTADSDMEPPLVWITNELDRSPGELLWVTSDSWGRLKGSLLSLSYGTGRIFIVPHERIGDRMQGGVAQLPIPEFPTGVMRGRFHSNGHLYLCGMYAWAGNQQRDGGFYRLRATGRPAWVPIGLHARTNQLEVVFSDSLDPAATANPANFQVKAWSLKRSANYGSRHLDEHPLPVRSTHLADDHRTIFLEIPGLHATAGMEVRATLGTPGGTAIQRTIHNTIHLLGPAAKP